MKDQVAFIFDREKEKLDPVMIFVLKDGKFRAYAPAGSPREDLVASLNKNLRTVEGDDLDESFNDLADRYNGISTMSELGDYSGSNLRRAEVFLRKWNNG